MGIIFYHLFVVGKILCEICKKMVSSLHYLKELEVREIRELIGDRVEDQAQALPGINTTL